MTVPTEFFLASNPLRVANCAIPYRQVGSAAYIKRVGPSDMASGQLFFKIKK